MAASELAVSLAIARLHDFLILSRSRDIISHRNLTDLIFESISNVPTILSTSKRVKLKDGINQETEEGGTELLLCAREAEKIAEAFLVDLLGRQMSKWQGGRFAKVFALVRHFSVMSPTCARNKMADDFTSKVNLLFSKLKSSPSAEGLPNNEKASSSSSSKWNRKTTRQRVESDIIGHELYVKDLLTQLTNGDGSNLRVISVVGKHACGKTVLVRSVFNKLKIKHHFDCRAWVHVSDFGAESDQMKNILVDILKQTPLKDQAKNLEHKQEQQLFEMLHKLLMDLRYLIVLDDLGEASLINKLLVPFVDSSRGSRVIVTTTNENMQKFADPWTPILRLPTDMTVEECKKLLRVSITGDDHSESDMTKLEKILSKYNHSPPAISLLGGLLSAVEESNWADLVDRLGEYPTLDDVTRLSFDELPYMMKPCVLYMALFPKESEVPTRRLFRLWAAEGLVAEAADQSVRMRSADYCFGELESRNLIRVVRRNLRGGARSCRMPAFLHEFFCLRAKKFELLWIPYSSDSVSEKESRGIGPVAEQSAHNQQEQVQNKGIRHYGYMVQCLQSFASFNTRKLGTQAREIEDLLKPPILDRRPDLLRVVDLEGVYKPVLPENFGNTLCNLRYLGLRWTVLDWIPESVGNLSLLETLDLKHTNITKVTSVIWNLENLRHLYLSEASFDKSIRRRISSVKSPNTMLETLWGLYIETDNCPMIGVLGKLQRLKKLGVTCRPEAVNEVTKCISNLTSLESLRLRSRDLFGQPSNLNLSDMRLPDSLSNLYILGSLPPKQHLKSVLPQNLKVLTLSMSGCEDDSMTVLQDLKDLTVLRLLARSFTGKSLWCRKAGFPKIRILKLWVLEELTELRVDQGGMPNLEELEIRQCEKLVVIDGLNHINSLKGVSLTRVKKNIAERLEVPQHTLVKIREAVSKPGEHFTINAKDLNITKPANWQWKNDSDRTQVAKVVSTKGLEVGGSFETIKLLIDRDYKVSFLTCMEETDSSTMGGQEVSLKLLLPGEIYQERQAKLPEVGLGGDTWHELEVGRFTMTRQNVGTMTFAMETSFSQMSGGLVIKGVEINVCDQKE